MLKSKLTALCGSQFMWHLLNQPNDKEMWEGLTSRYFFAPANIFVAALSVTLDTQAVPNLHKRNLAFLSWNPISQVHFFSGPQSQFADRDLTKTEMQHSRVYQGCCYLRLLYIRMCFTPVDSWAPGRKTPGLIIKDSQLHLTLQLSDMGLMELAGG